MSKHFVAPNPKPPAHIARYVEILGEEMAVEFLLAFGGADLYLAPNPKGRSELAKVVGMKHAAELAAQADRLPRRVPTGKIWIAAVLRSKGLSVADIARRLHSSDVSVRAWLKAFTVSTPDSDQPSLF